MSRPSSSSLCQGPATSGYVAGVPVGHHGEVGVGRDHLREDLDVPSRLDLDLDPAEALSHPLLDLGQQLLDARLDAEALAGRDRDLVAAEHVAQRPSELLGRDRPGCAFEAVLGHVVALVPGVGGGQLGPAR